MVALKSLVAPAALLLLSTVGAGRRTVPTAARVSRDLPGTGRDQYDRLDRRHGQGRRGDGGTFASRRSRRHAGALLGSTQGQPGGAPSRHWCAPSDPSDRAYRCGRGQARRLGVRSIQAAGGRWCVPGARRDRRQGDGGGVRRQPDRVRQGRVSSRPGYHRGADRRRGTVRLPARRRALAAAKIIAR